MLRIHLLPVSNLNLRRHVRTLATAPPVGPLSGIRVIDCTRILAGPWCTMQLGDMGADVIKIEALEGDDTRRWGPPFVVSPSHSSRRQSAYFLSCNRNKRSVALDLKSAEGRDIMYGLVKTADVFVENFLPGKLESMGYGYAQLAALNPRLVYGSISGFGADGPASQRPGYDVGIAAYGGLMSITGPEGGDPVKVGVATTDMATGLYMHGAILAALFARHRTSLGARLDTSLLEVQIAGLANIASNHLNAEGPPKPSRRWGTAHESIVPYQAFQGADAKHFVVAAMNDAQYRDLCRTLGRPDLADDPRYTTNPSRVANRATLLATLKDAFAAKPRDAWVQALMPTSVTVAPVNSVGEALDDAQVRHRQMVVQLPHEALGRDVTLTGLPVKYGGIAPAAGSESVETAIPRTQASHQQCESPAQAAGASSSEAVAGIPRAAIRLPPPLLGEHTADVLMGVLGMSAADVERLAEKGVVRVLK